MPKLFVSRRIDGSMRVGDGEAVPDSNRLRFLRNNHIDPTKVVIARLTSSNNVMIVDNSNCEHIMQNVDGLITTNNDVYLALTVADCLPIVLYSPNKLIALLHCGWRGLDTMIIHRAVTIAKDLGISPQDLTAIIGPGIEGHHYPVDVLVAQKFELYPKSLVKKDNVNLLDIKAVAKFQLEKLGVERIQISPICTYCDTTYFSARRDQTSPTQVMMAITML